MQRIGHQYLKHVTNINCLQHPWPTSTLQLKLKFSNLNLSKYIRSNFWFTYCWVQNDHSISRRFNLEFWSSKGMFRNSIFMKNANFEKSFFNLVKFELSDFDFYWICNSILLRRTYIFDSRLRDWLQRPEYWFIKDVFLDCVFLILSWRV